MNFLDWQRNRLRRYYKAVDNLKETRNRLLRENAALRKDKERLDWLCKHLFITRSAIDADRKEAQP